LEEKMTYGFVYGARWVMHDADTGQCFDVSPEVASRFRALGLVERDAWDKNIKNGIEYAPLVLRYWLKPGAIPPPREALDDMALRLIVDLINNVRGRFGLGPIPYRYNG
jgi:hypothetical protein